MIDALSQAGSRETGGILMGEHVGEDTFRVAEITIQRRPGTFATFVRALAGVAHALTRFFRRTNYEYTRFNYLGEWHSHPSFALEPSASDRQSMLEIVEDPDVGANFAVLMIVRLQNDELEGAAFVFQPGGQISRAALELEEPVS